MVDVVCCVVGVSYFATAAVPAGHYETEHGLRPSFSLHRRHHHTIEHRVSLLNHNIIQRNTSRIECSAGRSLGSYSFVMFFIFFKIPSLILVNPFVFLIRMYVYI